MGCSLRISPGRAAVCEPGGRGGVPGGRAEMGDESGDLRVVLAPAVSRPRRRTLPGWARSCLLGFASGSALEAVLAATGPVVSVGGTAGTTRMQLILLLAALPALLVMGWTIVRDWRHGVRRADALIGRALALTMVAVALPLSNYWLNRAANDPKND